VGLAAGLAALAFGLTDLSGPGRGWLRWGTLTALALAAAVLVLSLAIAVAATNVPPTSLGAETPADRGLPFEAVEFPAADGVTLSGWYVPSQNGAAVVLLHGAGSTRSAVLDHAVVLAGNGYGVLLFDARGHGESAGRAMDFGWYGDADIGGALDYLSQRPGVEAGRIALVGLSMGGEEAIAAAAGDLRVQGVVAEGATGRTAADRAWLSEQYGFRGLIQEGVNHLTYWLADLMTSAGPPISLHDAVVQMAPRQPGSRQRATRRAPRRR
jgi:pimeloyl-ACP methyl ester carboxylesterase